ncbi:hypothetical protein SAMN05443287_11571 [Micromonospora phaseoli]|uniref:Uncharacterized protein n=1 Tax=Micromonospora phaseoli TaxID=1144548 RepID=A0A1H7DUV2_9ACTN|nr:hypothetical protein [Micromonospora phaseoli]PZV89471.1 hypothetical protein CLV64_11572 [Micromonospora phaseoli]GIJ80615.1 hypothetical protein Xph01_50470 [Micromonospora phaseoli]SEK03070.1 hypothetical protein SAMN05443287_11571 [Micromonospora phaseoli]
MNLSDLRQVLDERSADSTELTVHHLRLHGVRAKVAARRRLRIMALTSTVALVLVAVAVAVPASRRDVAPTPAVSPSPTGLIEGFPEYFKGTRVTGEAVAVLPERRVEVTVVPTTLDLVLFHRCDGIDDGILLDSAIGVDGRVFGTGGCVGQQGPEDWAELGVKVGKPVTFTMTITGARDAAAEQNPPTVVPEHGMFGLAVGERVPFDEYPLPARPPGPLPSLDEQTECVGALCPYVVTLRSDPADPTRTISQTLSWRTLSHIDLVTQTPGRLRVRIDDVEITTTEWWDYEPVGVGLQGDRDLGWKEDFGLDLNPGEQVTVEVVPEHFTGEWRVLLIPNTVDQPD